MTSEQAKADDLSGRLAQMQTLLDENRAKEAATIGEAALQVLDPVPDATPWKQYLDGAFCNALGNCWLRLNEPRRALSYYERSLPVAKSVDDTAAAAVTLNNIGNAYRSLLEARRAIHYYLSSLELAREGGKLSIQRKALHNIGLAYSQTEEPAQAIEYFEQSLAIAEQTADKGAQAETLNTLGLACRALGAFQRAIGYYSRCLSISEEMGHSQGQASALGNLASAHMKLLEADSALAYYEQSLALLRTGDDKRAIATTLTRIARICSTAGNAERAIEAYREGLSLKVDAWSATSSRRSQWVSLDDLNAASMALEGLLLHQNDASLEEVLRLAVARHARNLGNTPMAQGSVASLERHAGDAEAVILVYLIDFVGELLTIVAFGAADQPFGHQYTGPVIRRVSLAAGESKLSGGGGDCESSGQEDHSTADSTVVNTRCQFAWRPQDTLRKSQELQETLRNAMQPGHVPHGGYGLPGLYEMLIQPIEEVLAGVGRLIIVPDVQSDLVLVPFAALANPAGTPLIERFTISVVPSLDMLLHQLEAGCPSSANEELAAPQSLIVEDVDYTGWRFEDPLERRHRVGEAVFVRDSNASWTPATILQGPDSHNSYRVKRHNAIEGDRITVSLKDVRPMVSIGKQVRVRADGFDPHDAGAAGPTEVGLVTGPLDKTGRYEVTMSRLKSKRRFRPSKLLIVSDDPLGQLTLTAEAAHSMRQLRGASQLLSGSDASVEHVVSLLPSVNDVAFFATHSFVDAQVACRSGIAMSGTTHTSAVLTAGRIRQLDLQAQLVILSHCNTENGDVMPEGVSALAGSFLWAGCGAVLLSLWPVEISCLVKLLTKFYDARQEVLRKSPQSGRADAAKVSEAWGLTIRWWLLERRDELLRTVGTKMYPENQLRIDNFSSLSDKDAVRECEWWVRMTIKSGKKCQPELPKSLTTSLKSLRLEADPRNWAGFCVFAKA